MSRSFRFIVRMGLSLAMLAACPAPFAAGQTGNASLPGAQPDADAAQPQALKVIIAEITGMAQVRTTPTDKWQRATVGMELSTGAEVRTGVRSQVVCTIPPDQTITLDRLGTISILEALRSKGKTTTDLMMKYGRADYAIEAAGKEHDATIRTPNATLSVRGTAFTAYDQPPFAPSVQTYRGLVDFRYAKRSMAVGKGSIARGRRGPVETALDSTVVDPAAARARTTSENAVIATEISRGAVLGFDPFVQIATSMGGLGPQTDVQLIDSLPGRLNFVIRWNQPGTDFNLAVLKLAGDPLAILGAFRPSEVLYPGFGLDKTRTGGRIVVDNRGGPNGGQETGFYNTFEPGIYGLQALHAGGPGATVSFNAFLDGKPQLLFATQLDADGNPVPAPDGESFLTEFSNTITRPIEPGGLEVATALIPFPPELLPAKATSALRKNAPVTPSGAKALPRFVPTRGAISAYGPVPAFSAAKDVTRPSTVRGTAKK